MRLLLLLLLLLLLWLLWLLLLLWLLWLLFLILAVKTCNKMTRVGARITNTIVKAGSFREGNMLSSPPVFFEVIVWFLIFPVNIILITHQKEVKDEDVAVCLSIFVFCLQVVFSFVLRRRFSLFITKTNNNLKSSTSSSNQSKSGDIYFINIR